jgi:hypothetical protein
MQNRGSVGFLSTSHCLIWYESANVIWSSRTQKFVVAFYFAAGASNNFVPVCRVVLDISRSSSRRGKNHLMRPCMFKRPVFLVSLYLLVCSAQVLWQNSTIVVLQFESTELFELQQVESEESCGTQSQENSRPTLTSGGKRQMKRAVRYQFARALSIIVHGKLNG